MLQIQIDKLESQVKAACVHAFADIVAACKNEQLYAIRLFTNDALHAASLIANTEEQLKSTVKRYNETLDKEYDITSTLNGMRWSYGDWGMQNIGSEHFSKVNESLFAIAEQLDEFDDDSVDEYFDQLWGAVLRGFSSLNEYEEFSRFNRHNVEEAKTEIERVINSPVKWEN
jgi:hypothetical protein